MEIRSFTIVHLNNLTIAHLYALTQSSIAYATPAADNLSALLRSVLMQLADDSNVLGDQMKKASKNVFTTRLAEMDLDCDDRYSEIKRNIRTAEKGRDAGKRAAAEALGIFLGPYWENHKQAMNTQISVFREMFSKFKASDTLKAHAATIGITAMMDGLEAANTAFGELYQTRDSSDAALAGPTASSLKSALISSYTQFCTAVEQAINYTPSEILNTLFTELEELRKTYAPLASRPQEAVVEAPAV